MNSLHSLAAVLEAMNNEIVIDEGVRKQAVKPLERMMSFGRETANPGNH